MIDNLSKIVVITYVYMCITLIYVITDVIIDICYYIYIEL